MTGAIPEIAGYTVYLFANIFPLMDGAANNFNEPVQGRITESPKQG
jgi:hypothetical protein